MSDLFSAMATHRVAGAVYVGGRRVPLPEGYFGWSDYLGALEFARDIGSGTLEVSIQRDAEKTRDLHRTCPGAYVAFYKAAMATDEIHLALRGSLPLFPDFRVHIHMEKKHERP